MRTLLAIVSIFVSGSVAIAYTVSVTKEPMCLWAFAILGMTSWAVGFVIDDGRYS